MYYNFSLSDFMTKNINLKTITDYELYKLKNSFFKDVNIKYKNIHTENIYDEELKKRITYITKKISINEGFDDNVLDNVVLNENIYYHITNIDVIDTGINLSQERTVTFTPFYSINEKHLNISPGFIYLYKNSKQGLRMSLNATLKSGKLLVKLVIPKDRIILDADQLRFHSFIDGSDLNWDEAQHFIESNEKLKNELEKLPYRATPYIVEPYQIIEILYDANTITYI